MSKQTQSSVAVAEKRRRSLDNGEVDQGGPGGQAE